MQIVETHEYVSVWWRPLIGCRRFVPAGDMTLSPHPITFVSQAQSLQPPCYRYRLHYNEQLVLLMLAGWVAPKIPPEGHTGQRLSSNRLARRYANTQTDKPTSDFIYILRSRGRKQRHRCLFLSEYRIKFLVCFIASQFIILRWSYLTGQYHYLFCRI